MVVCSSTLMVAAAAVGHRMRTLRFNYWHGPYTWVTNTTKTKSHEKQKGLKKKKFGKVLYDKI